MTGLEPEAAPIHVVSNQNETIHAACNWFQRRNRVCLSLPNKILLRLHGPLSFSAVEEALEEVIQGHVKGFLGQFDSVV
jgi:hypothetical protein